MNQQQHRDNLIWSVQSAPLINPADPVWPDTQWFRSFSLKNIDRVAECDPGKLGRYFEHLIQQWLQYETDLECLAANLPVRNPERTLGEFDLIVRNQAIVEHWEVAVKFYLGTADCLHMNNWFGPNPTDTLWHKMTHLGSKQLRLSELPEAKELLAANGWQVARTRCLLKGRLFHRLASNQAELPDSGTLAIPAGVSAEHERGWWLPAEELGNAKALKGGKFCVLPKPQWLAPLTDLASPELKTADQICAEFENAVAGTLHIAHVDDHAGRELSRGFLVKTRWQEDVAQIIESR